MKLHDFNRAIAPQLQVKIQRWFRVDILHCYAKDLKANLRMRLMTVCPERTPAFQAILDQWPDSPEQRERDIVRLLCMAFFVHTENYYNMEAGSKVELRIFAYESRLRQFLGKLEATLMDQNDEFRESRKHPPKELCRPIYVWPEAAGVFART